MSGYPDPRPTAEQEGDVRDFLSRWPVDREWVPFGGSAFMQCTAVLLCSLIDELRADEDVRGAAAASVFVDRQQLAVRIGHRFFGVRYRTMREFWSERNRRGWRVIYLPFGWRAFYRFDDRAAS